MSFRSKIKKNIPKVALHSIRSLIAGGYKTGKTRLWKEVTELHYENPAEETLLVAFEKGYETWELESVYPIHEEGEGWHVWEAFRKFVKEVVAEAKENKKIKLIGIDTADRAIDFCTEWILHESSKRYGKKFTSLQDITENTNDNGYLLLADEMSKQFDALENAGYGIMSLAWTKEKETTLHNGLKYNSLTLMMSSTGRRVFESQASLICTLFNEVTVLDKDGNELEENIRDKKGRERASNFHKTRTVMLFRPNEYVEIAGGRYINLPEDPIEYSAKLFLEVYEKAVLGQLKNPNEFEKIKNEEEEFREKRAKAFAEQVEIKQRAENLHNAIKDLIETKNINIQTKKEILVPKFKEIMGVVDFTQVYDLEKLEQIYDFVNNL